MQRSHGNAAALPVPGQDWWQGQGHQRQGHRQTAPPPGVLPACADPASYRGLQPKRPNGPLASYCINCGEHKTTCTAASE